MSDYDQYLKTLRRVPDRVILATMGRDLELAFNGTCLCGWFVRERLAEMRNVGASSVGVKGFASYECAELFGGTDWEWIAIYRGVTDARLPVIEAAFVQRVDEAVYGRAATP